MDSPAPRLSESNLRKLSRGLRSSKKSRLSVHSALETQSVQDGGSFGGRSVSLSTLLPSCGTPGVGPRVDKLQSLEAKMANIEASLGWRRRREALLETLPRAARDLVRELDSLHQTVRDKESTIQTLRRQITNLGGTVAGNDSFGGAVCEAEKKNIQERLEKVQSEIDSKKVAIKNIKLTLEKIDVTDNIDVRIRAAELEYELEREELNVLTLKEESSLLSSRLQESCSGSSLIGGTNSNQSNPKTFFELISGTKGSSVIVGTTLVSASVCHAPGNPPFHVTSRPPFGCVIDWATDDTRLKKGDRLIEINGVIVIGEDIEEVTKFMADSSLLSLIVARPTVVSEETLKKLEKQLEDKQKENKDLVARLDKALRERDNFKNDNTRLNHRICYLEDQVSELEDSLKKPQKSHPNSTANVDAYDLPVPSQPGATIIQVFQKGSPKSDSSDLAADSAKKNKLEEYAYIPRIKSPASFSSSSSDSLKNLKANIPKRESYFNSSSSDSSSPSLEKCLNKDVSKCAESNKSDSFKAATSADLKDHQRTLTSQPSSNSQKSYIDDDFSLHKTSMRGLLKGSIGHYTSQESIDKLERNSVSNRISEDDSKPSKKQGFSISIDENERDINTLEPQKSHKSKEIATTLSQSKVLSQGQGENVGRHSRNYYQRRQSDFSGSESSHNGKSHRGHLNERPRKFLSPGQDYNRNEPEIKLPRPRPIPPKKPERLSLHRTTSLQSVEDTRPSSRASSVSTSTRPPIISQHWHSCDNDLNTDGEITDYEELRILRRSIQNDKNEYSYLVGPIPEERPPNPIPRNSLQKNFFKPKEKQAESERLSTTSVDSDYDSSPRQVYGKMKPIKVTSKAKPFIDPPVHLDTPLGLDYHHDVRAQPIYEYLPKLNSNGRISRPVPKPRERDLFQAPPTPSTPPRGVDLRVAKSYRSDEEWC